MTEPAATVPRTGRALPAVAMLTAWALLVFLCFRIVRHDPSALAQLAKVDATTIAAITLFMFFVMVFNGMIFRDLVRHFGLSMPIRIWLGITLVSSLVNLVSPIRGGIAARAVYLKQMYSMRYADFACVQAASLVFTLSTTACVALCALVALGIPGGSAGRVALAFSVLIAFVPPIVLSAVPPIDGRIRRLPGILARMHEGWLSIRDDRGLLVRLAAWNIAAVSCHSVAFVCAFDAAGFDGHWLIAVTSSAFARFGTLIAITPAGLGVFEAFGVVSAKIVGAGVPAAVVAVLLVRAVGTACTVIGGLACAPFLAGPSGQKTSGD